MTTANTTGLSDVEDKGHTGNPSKQCAVDTSSADVDLTDSSHLGSCAVGLYVGTTGDVKAAMRGDSGVVYKTVPAGAYLPGLFITVYKTGTTATNIVAVGK